MLQFTPIVDFESEEMKSVYVKGMVYTVRDGNDRLMQEVAKWVEEGKVTVGAPNVRADDARVRGVGEVSN